MAFDAPEAAADRESELRPRGTPERAEAEKRYLKSDLDFAGCTVGQHRISGVTVREAVNTPTRRGGTR
jgi:hypothetical protein